MMRRARPWRGWRSRRSDHAQRPVSSSACNIISINRTIISANTPLCALEALSTARASVLNVFLTSRARALDGLHASRARVAQRFPHISRARPRRSPCIFARTQRFPHSSRDRARHFPYIPRGYPPHCGPATHFRRFRRPESATRALAPRAGYSAVDTDIQQ